MKFTVYIWKVRNVGIGRIFIQKQLYLHSQKENNWAPVLGGVPGRHKMTAENYRALYVTYFVRHTSR